MAAATPPPPPAAATPTPPKDPQEAIAEALAKAEGEMAKKMAEERRTWQEEAAKMRAQLEEAEARAKAAEAARVRDQALQEAAAERRQREAADANQRLLEHNKEVQAAEDTRRAKLQEKWDITLDKPPATSSPTLADLKAKWAQEFEERQTRKEAHADSQLIDSEDEDFPEPQADGPPAKADN